MGLGRTKASVAVLSVLLAASGKASSEDNVTLPAARAELVRLDAVVTDARGSLVGDLKGEDFAVLDDGQLQQVAQFVVVRSAALPVPATEGSVAQGPVEAESHSPGVSRHIVVVVDDLHIARGNISFVKEALRRLVQEWLEPNDKVAVVVTSGGGDLSALTQDRATLLQAIDHLNTHDSRPTQVHASDLTAEHAEQILRGDVNALKLAAETMTEEVGSRFTNAPVNESFSNIAVGGIEPTRSAAALEAMREARAVLGQALQYSVASLTTIESVLRGVARLPGRKICLLVSDGFLVGTGTQEERSTNLQAMVDAATRSGAVVYALDSKGLVTGLRDSAVVSGPDVYPDLHYAVDRLAERQLQTTLERVSRDTGGFVIQGTNDLAGGLHRMLQDNETYYLLAYQPVNLKRDGKFHKIEIKIPSHTDYLVRTRAGYLAPGGKPSVRAAGPSPQVPRTSQDALDPGALRAILSTPLPPIGRIPVEMAADFIQRLPLGPLAVVHAHLPVEGLRWDEVAGTHRASFDFAGAIYDEDGIAVVAPFGRHTELSLGGADYRRLQAEGFEFQEQLPLGPGRYQVRVVARDSRGSGAGGAARWLEIPNLEAKKLAVSGLFLAARGGMDPASVGAESVRDAQVFRLFKGEETLYFQLYVYNPLTDGAGNSDVLLQAQIWSAGRVLAASKPQRPAFRREMGILAPETAGMSLAGMTPGLYSLKVIVVDRKAETTVSRDLDFRVE